HSRRLLERLLERHHPLGAIGVRVHRALDVRAQHRERRLELVAGVRGEPAKRRERFLEAREHRVDGDAQPRQLVVARIGRKSSVIASTSLISWSTGRNALPTTKYATTIEKRKMIGATTMIVPISSCGDNSASVVGSAVMTRAMFGLTVLLRRPTANSESESLR